MEKAIALVDDLKIARRAAQEHILKSNELPRLTRERLARSGWMQPIIRGWYLLTKPENFSGESTLWYASFWSFIKYYLSDHYDNAYCLNPVSSVLVHVENTFVPKQLIAMIRQGGTRSIELPHATSLLVYVEKTNFPRDTEEIRGLCVMTLPSALPQLRKEFYRNYPLEAEMALRMVRDVAKLTRILIERKMYRASDVLAGAYQFLKDDKSANEVIRDMAVIGYRVHPENPFDIRVPSLSRTRIVSPYVGRIEALWNTMRNDVIEVFPRDRKMTVNIKACLRELKELYVQDAYHSLSIEGYEVTKDLIEKIEKGEWNPEANEEDRHLRDALAAKGYFLAFKMVEENIQKVLRGKDAAQISGEHLQEWYKKLFEPSLHAGLIKAIDLIGFRSNPVYIRGAMHIPPAYTYIPDLMDKFFELLKAEKEARVRAILGHFLFVYIHPYMDGNGRLARFLMNVMLISGGFHWTIIRKEHRRHYFVSLEAASVKGDIKPFAKFIRQEMNGS